MGYILENTIRSILQDQKIDREVTTLLSQVEVDPEDPAFQQPTKPIGPFYTRFRARQLTREKAGSYTKMQGEDTGWSSRRLAPKQFSGSLVPGF